jgi:hypothetical protein
MRSERTPPPTSIAPSSRTARARGKRDQDPSTFTVILERLVRSIAGAQAAALVDAEGETVDYAGFIDPFETKVAAAHWQIAMHEIGDCLGGIRQITVRARGKSYLVRQIHTEYKIVLILHRRAGFAASERALQEAHVRLCIEAGFPPPPRALRWFGVDVEPEPKDRSRPARLRVASHWQPVEVMGSVVGLARREKGFRVRLPNGAEMLLVRERLGQWFADEHVED